jgi:hypothetical protein
MLTGPPPKFRGRSRGQAAGVVCPGWEALPCQSRSQAMESAPRNPTTSESADAPSRQVSPIHSRAFAASAIGYTRPSMGMNMAMNFVVRLIHSTSVTTAKRSQSNM